MKPGFRGSERQFAQIKRKRKPACVGCYKFFIWLAAFLLFSGKIFAANVPDDFSTANKLYAEGKFSDAANLYKKILASGQTSPNLLFNFGNAEFKAGNLGKAIAAYRRAELLAPRDSEIRANLDFARKQVQGPTVSESRWQDWLGQLTLNEWAILAAIAFWLTFILLAAKQIKAAQVSSLREKQNNFTGKMPALFLRRAIFICGALAILFGVATGLQTAEHFSNQSAVVISNDIVAKSGPFDDAQKTFSVRDGEEFLVLDHHDNWVQVDDGSGKIGWLQLKQVEVLPGA
ncbi:MAG TPA: tetratricopeptide repeat protein [Verrucomicrobiae bacterium]|nr:tetratricopeptide repeat protein [Verrucomicrobiae bacterium]